MDFTTTDYAIQAGPSALQNVTRGLKKIFTRDPGISLQCLMTVPVIAAGIVFHVSVGQWFVIILTTLVYLLAAVFRTASLLQVNNSDSLSPFEISRIKCIGTGGVVVTAGISLLAYALVFIPRIIPLL